MHLQIVAERSGRLARTLLKHIGHEHHTHHDHGKYGKHADRWTIRTRN